MSSIENDDDSTRTTNWKCYFHSILIKLIEIAIHRNCYFRSDTTRHIVWKWSKRLNRSSLSYIRSDENVEAMLRCFKYLWKAIQFTQMCFSNRGKKRLIMFKRIYRWNYSLLRRIRT
uniref:AlNc14C252G9658 protein n=1 Tax=Albugo laibachii Nc14 TaxID=890382 RepID=F0WTH8_9STRA|nr:AlNc14C252G9658 [Albugo laibachii Nc14]|eukprot:CCA24669.1 AlNc14C252G9658 [Albugo laibachii Nc14]